MLNLENLVMMKPNVIIGCGLSNLVFTIVRIIGIYL